MWMIILQGEPGAGKTTFANFLKSFIPDLEICSTDSFAYVDGVYKFQPEKLGEFHKLNPVRAEALLLQGKSVVVDNTNSQAWEAKPYVQLALTYGAQIIFARPDNAWANEHGVPHDKVLQIRSRLEVLSVSTCLTATVPTSLKRVKTEVE